MPTMISRSSRSAMPTSAGQAEALGARLHVRDDLPGDQADQRGDQAAVRVALVGS